MNRKYERKPSRHNLLRRVGTICAVGGLFLTGCSRPDTKIFEEYHRPDITNLDICDEANLRDAPYVANSPDERGEKIGKLDYGNAPEGTCLTISIEGGVYKITGTNNGTWYGLPAEQVNKIFTDQPLKSNPSEGSIAWINEARARESTNK